MSPIPAVGAVAAAASTSPNVLWYVTRGTAFVSLSLLTLSVAGGILNSVRWRSDSWPRFAVQQVHRNGSLLGVAFLTVHVVTAVVDPFAKLKVTDALIPFTSGYRPLWLGFGVIAMEMLVALVITSLLRGRLGFRTWRAVHWLAYICWPIALVHGMGTGTDTRTAWGLFIDVVCAGVVLVAVVWRISDGWPRAAGVRSASMALTSASALVIGAWAVHGPLKAGWARAAGTPEALLAAQNSTGQASRPSPSGPAAPTPAPTPAPPTLVAGLRDRLNGSATQDQGGGLRVDLADQTNPSVHLLVVLTADQQATLTVTRSGAQVCQVPAQVARGVSAVCGNVVVRLALEQADDGGVVGEMTTRAAE